MGSWKFEADLGADGLPQFLRDLAEALEAGEAGAGPLAQHQDAGALAGLPALGVPGGMRKLVLVAAAKEGVEGEAEGASRRFTLKLKAKRGHEVRVPTKRPGPAVSPAGAKQREPGSFSADKGTHGPKDFKQADALARAREKYRQLKKAMQAEYKALQKAAEAGLLPAQDALDSFLALCESMLETKQPLKSAAGPEAVELAQANQAFFEDARALRRAVSARDTAAFAEVLARLERRKSACHAQFR